MVIVYPLRCATLLFVEQSFSLWVADSIENANTRTENAHVTAGIAWDAAGKRLFLTGKYWPRIYQVKLRRLTGAAASSEAVDDARSVCIPKIAAVGWR